MKDLISRQAAIDLFPNDALEWDTNCGYIAPHFARRMIEELPSAQSEIIRCKDCKHYFAKPEYHWGICEAHGNPPHEADETDYCSWAERKEE